MAPEEFICKHITEKLVAEGFPEIVAKGGGSLGAGLLPAQLTSQP
ncbi:hypothetical protein [Escherichia coli]|nr:hypothetical protein [Escherichia coli]